MKNILIAFFLIISSLVSSQNVEKTITVIDAETNLPIEDVTIFILKTKQSLISNVVGKVNFKLAGSSNIQVTHSAYVTVTVRSSALLKTDNIIYLKSNVTNLDEIIITKQHPQKILKALVENSIKKLTVPARLKVYTREFFKLNGNYAYYNDGLMNFQVFGKEKKFKSNILVEQNRSFGLVNEEISSDVLGYNLNDIMQNYYNFKYLNPLLDSKSRKDFDFVLKAYTKNKNYNIMLVSPLENTKGLQDDYTIIYDYKKKIIIEVSTIVSPSTIARIKDKNWFKKYLQVYI